MTSRCKPNTLPHNQARAHCQAVKLSVQPVEAGGISVPFRYGWRYSARHRMEMSIVRAYRWIIISA